MSETLFEELKRYVRFSDSDVQRLMAVEAHVAPHFARISEEFYARIHEHEDAHAVFRDAAQVDRLKSSLVKWMGRVFRGPHDEAYFEQTSRIGRVHVQVGLPQRYMLTSMSLIRASLVALAPDTATADSIGRALDLELAVMLESYRDHFVARLESSRLFERAQLGDELRKSAQRYVSAIELVHMLVVGIDSEGRVQLFNAEAERTTGYAADEARGRDFVELLVAPEHRALMHAHLAALDARGDELVATLQTRAGKLRDVRWQLARAPRDTDDAVVRFVIGHDVTDENAAAERTRQTERLAAVGTLAAGLAHEIRNPLHGAHLHVTFLERVLGKQHAEPDTLDAVKVVGQEITRLSNLVTEFLQFARPAPLARKPMPLAPLFEHVARLLAADAEQRGVSLAQELPAQSVVVDCDVPKLEQVLLNLGRNAIEAAPRGGHVVLRLRRTPRHAQLEVEDDGPGLPDPDAPIFDAFFSTKPHGTGLGLAIVHRIVGDHGGTVHVQSTKGQTLFRVEVPLTSSEASP